MSQVQTEQVLSLSEDKKVILKQILAWFSSNKRPAYLTLGGFAGTGKTTLIAVLRRLLAKKNPKLRVAFVAFTGKATQTLQHYLRSLSVIYRQDNVSTIHSLIYTLLEKNSGQMIWQKKDQLKFDLIVIDEASMLDEAIWRDLLSYQIPILAVGDHGQLPPINGRFNLMQNPTLRLESIHRQEQGNPIIKLSVLARTTGQIPVGTYGKKVRKLAKSDPESGELVENYLQSANQETLILCGYNHTRVKLNQYLRNIRGIEGQLPQAGDRLICLRNNYAKGIFNGMLGTLERVSRQDEDLLAVEIDFDDGQYYEGLALAKQFHAPANLTYSAKIKQLLKTADLFDFGYALTVHKAQGSQAKRVILFEERFKQMTAEDWRRWLYTAVTRAEEELIIIGD